MTDTGTPTQNTSRESESNLTNDKDELEGLSPESDPDTFWSQVDANIAAGYLRLVFVADRAVSTDSADWR